MKRLKKRLIVVLAAMLGILGLGMLGGCGEDDIGSVCEIGEAYEAGLITHEDVQQIADRYNALRYNAEAEEQMTLEFGEKTIRALKKMEAEDISCRGGLFYPDYKIRGEELKITGYFGIYGNCVAFLTSSPWYFLDEATYVTIADITFDFSGSIIRIWVRE